MVRTRGMARDARNRTSWYQLPPELRLMIWEATLDSPKSGSNSMIGHLASVCRDWQVFFERHVFQHIVLDESRLPTFRQAIEHLPMRLAYIKAILLRIKLPEYDCKDCGNNKRFTSCIRQMFGVLALWKPTKHDSFLYRSAGLTLDITASSSSDTKHHFSFCELESTYPFLFEGDLASYPISLVEFHQQKASREASAPCQVSTRPGLHFYAKERLHGNPLQLKPTVPPLPRVPIVKGLLIRRQSYRSISIRSLAQILRQSLRALTWFRFEGREPTNFINAEAFAQDLIHHLLPALPRSLQSLYLSFWRSFKHTCRLRGIQPWELAETLAYNRVCRRLTEFSVDSQMVSSIFLGALSFGYRARLSRMSKNIRMPAWTNLELLCLSPQCFHTVQENATRGIQDTVRSAAMTARKLPRLRMMELWGANSNGSAYLFRYKLENDQPNVTWRSGGYRRVVLQYRTKCVWNWAVKSMGHRPFRFKLEPFSESTQQIQQSKGRFILQHLELRRLAVDPITLAQLEAEAATSATSGEENQ